MNAQTRVLLDVDGVLADFLTPAIKVVQDITGAPPSADAMKDWNIFRGYDKKTENKFYDVFKSEGWCMSLELYPGARAGVQLLRDNDLDVYFVTSPMHGRNWYYERAAWLMKHFDAKHDHVIHTNAKHVCVGRVLVDDKPAHVENWQASHPLSTGILWDRPYNQEVTRWITRANSWDFVLECALGPRE